MDRSMEQLKDYLITRLILVITCVLAVEAFVLLLVRGILLPLAAYAANFEPHERGLRLTDLFAVILSLIRGNSQQLLWGIAGSSGALLVMLLIVFLLLAPVAVGILVYAHLVTMRVDELQRQREAEHAAYDAQRNLMLSDFAHDLRTPIMTISGYAGALADGVVREEGMRQEYLEAIRRKSVRMGELINLLFEYVKLGSVSFHLKKEPCDLNALVAEAAASLYMDLEESGMEMRADIPEEPFTVEADRAQAGRVLNNLLVNAMRHNPEGTVVAVQVQRLAGMEEVAVADSGLPITKTAEELFEPFAKGDDSRGGDKGSGLGLSISKKIADMHGWELTLAQPYGSYTKAFVLRVPER